MATQGRNARENAIVIGASMAGLLAARALADHFDQVTLLERDEFPAPGENRKGVPQGRHTHVLLARGRDIMEDYLPGLSEALTRSGAVTIEDVSANVRWFNRGGFHQPGRCGVSGLGVSRPTLEAAVRKCVLAIDNICAIPESNVMRLATTPDHASVVGVEVEHRNPGGKRETMSADLVVDASGRGSRSPAWLEELGYQRPPEEEIRIGVGYTSRYYRRKPEALTGIHGIVLNPTPPDKRLGVLLDQDGDRWVVTLGGYLGDHAPTDPAGFLEFARSLPSPAIYKLIKGAEPLNEPVPYKFLAHLRQHYEKLTRFPQGYLIIGDALCSFNPIYGQGMTVAALEARALSEWLAEGGRPRANTYFAAMGKIIDDSWEVAVGNDLGYPEIEGQRTPMVRFLNWYLGKLHRAAHEDARVSTAFLKVINMVAPPPSILKPEIVWRVLKGNLRAGKRKLKAGGSATMPELY